MKSKSFDEIRSAFEQYFIYKGYGDQKDLDYYCMTEEEQADYPGRGDFVSYTSKEVNELFAFYMAGVRFCQE